MWQRLGAFRLLIAIYLAVTIAGWWEYASQSRPETAVGKVDWTDGGDNSYAQIIDQLYPESPDSAYLQGFRVALRELNPHLARKHFERALASGVKHNEDLLYYYTMALLYSGAADEEVDVAIRNWRRNYPTSTRPLAVPFANYAGSGDAAERARLALIDEKWIVNDSIRAAEQTIEMKLHGSQSNMRAFRQALQRVDFQFGG